MVGVRAMVLDGPGRPLRAAELERPEPGPGELLIRVEACGVCRTDLHLLDGEVEVRSFPRVLGHQIVGTADGRRVGVPWLAWTCGECRFCLAGRENLCPRARFTGRDVDGGFAEWAVADERFCFPIPDGYPADQAAPLLCAGLIGHRALRMAGDAARLGLYGFGAAAHIVCQVAVWASMPRRCASAPAASSSSHRRVTTPPWAGSSPSAGPGCTTSPTRQTTSRRSSRDSCKPVPG